MVPLLADDDLWERARIGDAEAFGALFERHGRALYNYCFRQTADWAAAEDLVSTVFLEAWRRRNQELRPDKVLAWLYGIATNVTRNYRRSRRRHEAALARLALPEPTADFVDDLLEHIDDQTRMVGLLRLTAKLSRRQRDVFALCVWSGLSYEDAGLALGLPTGTVKSNLSRARERMRELAVTCGHIQDENMIFEKECESDEQA
jgi:RNA polymerase sigma factor (sigma-70 family)